MSTLSPEYNKTSILNEKQTKFIEYYLQTGNITESVIRAGYKTNSPSRYGSDLLRKERVQQEILKKKEEMQQASIAKPTEILQFYTSVMRGEVLDQFGIEASLDTRIKAANELAKQQIEIPLKLEQKNITNNIGSIQLNFIPRTED